jgi:hypothetical protein
MFVTIVQSETGNCIFGQAGHNEMCFQNWMLHSTFTFLKSELFDTVRIGKRVFAATFSGRSSLSGNGAKEKLCILPRKRRKL